MYQFSRARVQMERRVGEGAPGESFFLIKDGIGGDCGVAGVGCGVSSIPPAAPSGPRSLSLPSVSPHQQSSRGGQVLPPDAAFRAIPLARKGTIKTPALKD